MKVCGNTDIGLVRKSNEDDYCVTKNRNGDWLAVVCDGIGGSQAGEVASHIAVNCIYEEFMKAPDLTKDKRVSAFIQESLNKANDKIYTKSMHNKKQRGMGTTCVGVIITKKGTYIFNVGDSRLYALYPDGFIQMSEDHSVIAQLLKEGKLSYEEAKGHAQRNTLTSALGVWRVYRMDLHKIANNFKALILCSDGLHGYVDDSEIEAVLASEIFTLQEKVSILISRANQAGGLDNCTIVILEKEEGDLHD